MLTYSEIDLSTIYEGAYGSAKKVFAPRRHFSSDVPNFDVVSRLGHNEGNLVQFQALGHGEVEDE